LVCQKIHTVEQSRVFLISNLAAKTTNTIGFESTLSIFKDK